MATSSVSGEGRPKIGDRAAVKFTSFSDASDSKVAAAAAAAAPASAMCISDAFDSLVAATAAGSEEKEQTSPAQSLQEKEIAERACFTANAAAASAFSRAGGPRRRHRRARSFDSEEIGKRADFTESTRQQAPAGPSEEKWQTSPAQSLQQKKIGKRADFTESTPQQSVAAALDSMMTLNMTVPRARGPRGRYLSLRSKAIVLVLAAAVVVAFSILLLAPFHGNPMFQVWILSVGICICVFIFLMCIRRIRWFYIDLARLICAPLIALASGSALGSATATFVLFFGMVWAAGNLGYSLAVHRLIKMTVSFYPVMWTPRLKTVGGRSFRVLTPATPTKDSVEDFNFSLYILAPFVLLLWTLFMALVLNIPTEFDELDMLMTLSYSGCFHVIAWIIFVALIPMRGYDIKEQIRWLMPSLLIWMLVSPLICFVSQILSVLCHLLLLMALVAFLWYNLALYTYFLATATPCYEGALMTCLMQKEAATQAGMKYKMPSDHSITMRVQAEVEARKTRKAVEEVDIHLSAITPTSLSNEKARRVRHRQQWFHPSSLAKACFVSTPTSGDHLE